MTSPAEEPLFLNLDKGEKAALLLGLHLKADLILIDERKGMAAALRKGLQTTGPLGILMLAAERNLVDLANSFQRLRQTSFYCPENVMQKLVAEQNNQGGW